MHFNLERAARVTEVGAPFPPITQEVTHRQPIPCSNPEMLLPCDSQNALITERRSMPFCHQFTSKTSTKSQSSNDASTIQRPASPVPTLSSRRSVSSMKELLPLKLQEIPPKIDLASWLDCTAPDMRNPVLPSLEHKEPAAYSLVPWMSSSQDMRISCDLPPNRYRETPIYSGSGSPMLSQAYFSDEELCYSCSPRSSVCDELCIVTDYEDAEVLLPYSHECPVDRADTIEDGRNGSIETSTTSFASTRFSTLSTGCHEEYVTPGEAAWMKSGLRSWTSGQTEEVPYGDGNLVVREDQSSFEGWLNSESSRSSSSFSSDEVLDALATKLAPAKAHVVELNKDMQIIPMPTSPPKFSLQGRPATPYRLPRIRGKPGNNPMLALKKETSDTRRAGARRDQRATLASSSVLDIQWKQSVQNLPYSSKASQSFGVYEEPPSKHQCPDAEPDGDDSITAITDSIYGVIQCFPKQMLFLDTPCVTDIRYQNHLVRHATNTQSFFNPSSSSSTYSLPLERLNSPTHQRRNGNNFFAPFLRATARKSSLFGRKVTPSYVDRPSSCMSASWRSLAPQPDIPPPELSVFRHIFPNTQDWWRSVLYAHLVAYNYVSGNLTPPQHNSRDFPSKACRTLGISTGHFRGAMPTTEQSTRFADLEERLVYCITWITSCMTGNSDVQENVRKSWIDRERDFVLARALAEIVKECERGGGGLEANVPPNH